MKKILIVVFLLLLSAYGYTQRVSGTVTDDKGGPLPGVSVIVKGTTIGVATGADGTFSLTPGNINSDVLQFTFVGFEPQEIPINGQTTFKVMLKPSDIYLDEIVAIGYGVVKKRDLTGSVASVKSDEIIKTTSSNAMQAIQGRVAGVDIQQSDGQAGSGVNINLRGYRSINASNKPLILVDGVDYGSTLDINPSDIESFDILKDASSTAIYGTRGSNGVILITTKHGKSGKTLINFNSFISSNSPTNVPQVMYGRKEVQRLVDKANYQADATSGNWGTSNLTPESILTESLVDGTTELSIYQDGSYTNWADIILKNGITQNYELSASGGNDKTTFNVSLGTMYEQGLMRKDLLDRYNGKVNIDHKINDIFKVGTSILYTYKNHDARNSSVFSQSLKLTSITHAYLNDETLNATPNPRYAAHCSPLLDEIPGNFQNNIETTRFFGNAYLEITPIKGLVAKSVFTLNRQNDRTGLYQDFQSVARYQSPATSFISLEYEKTTGFTWDNTLNYTTNFNGTKHNLTALLGHSLTQSVYEEMYTSGDAGKEHYYKSSFYDISKIGTETSTSNYIKTSMLSYFGRINYKYNEKYLLTASLRTDGSSTLAKGHKWGYFPSVAAAWRISEEGFMEKTSDWLSNLKLRAAYGISGNAAIDAYKTLATLSGAQVYYYMNGSSIAGNYPSSMSNPNLTWEKTASLDFGVDFGILKDRINGSVDYYFNHTTDLLYQKSAPPSSVFPSVWDNIGETKGHGLEIALNTVAVKSKDFSWDINWSFTTLKDKIIALSDNLTRNINGTSGQIVGQPVLIYYDYKADGCWGVGEFATYTADWKSRHPDETLGYVSAYGAPGTIKIIDRDDNGKLDDSDKFIYRRSPKFIFGMNNTVNYKNFSLSVLVYARLGGYISYGMNNQLNYESANWGDLDYWTPTNAGAKFPSPGAASTTYATYGSALMYEKADYIKIKDVTLSYSLPKILTGKIGIEGVRFYGSLKNYFTFSKIDNYDPERGGSISFPLAKQVVFGLNVQF
jgi:TonB-dependent starch-binding outer membrane protein SusC